MIRVCVLFVCLVVLAAACTPAPKSATPSVTAQNAFTLREATSAPSPTQSEPSIAGTPMPDLTQRRVSYADRPAWQAILGWPVIYSHPKGAVSPSATQVPPIPASSPHLVYVKKDGSRPALVIMDASGVQRQLRALPDDALIAPLAQAVSPHGRWLAFHRDSATVRSGVNAASSNDLSLDVMNLEDGRVQFVVSLLSGDGASIPEALRSAFLSGIRALAWSPDGRHLAFAGQMDGPSSDLYVYDMDADTIRRLSDGPGMIQSIAWSPDGRWIVHSSISEAGEGIFARYHAAAADGTTIKPLPDALTGILGWIAPSVYLQSDANNGPAGAHNLHSVEIETGAPRTLWAGTFLSFAVDLDSNLLAVAGFETVGAKGAPALYLVNLVDGTRRRIDGPSASVTFLGVASRRFAYTRLAGDALQTMLLDSDGAPVALGYDAGRVIASPDRNLVLAVGQEARVYSSDGALMSAIALPTPVSRVSNVLWRPDASGFFFTLGSDLYAADVSGGEAYRVDRGVPEGRSFDYAWTSP